MDNPIRMRVYPHPLEERNLLMRSHCILGRLRHGTARKLGLQSSEGLMSESSIAGLRLLAGSWVKGALWNGFLSTDQAHRAFNDALEDCIIEVLLWKNDE